jgi:hypothetical protein
MARLRIYQGLDSSCEQRTYVVRSRRSVLKLTPTHRAGAICAVPEHMGLKLRNVSPRCGRVCSVIVYSVRIGPPATKKFFLSAIDEGGPFAAQLNREHAFISTNPATVRIDNFEFQSNTSVPSERTADDKKGKIVSELPVRTKPPGCQRAAIRTGLLRNTNNLR